MIIEIQIYPLNQPHGGFSTHSSLQQLKRPDILSDIFLKVGSYIELAQMRLYANDMVTGTDVNF